VKRLTERLTRRTGMTDRNRTRDDLYTDEENRLADEALAALLAPAAP
jgi:hypothetical protein